MNLGVSLLTFLVIVAVTTGRSISNNDKDGKKKTSAIDLGFLIENPGNEGTEGEEPLKGVKDAFLQSRDFVQDLAKYFKVSVSGAHIGVVTYGTEPYMAFDFNEHLSNQQVKDALSGLTRPSRGSKVTKALKFVRDQLFEGSARPDARKILIILASKGARGDLPRIADQLKKSGVTIYSIAVDSTKLGAISLNDVVSDPIKNHRFKSDSTNLRGLVTKMKDLILNPKPKRKSSVLERLQNINASDTMKDAPEHIEPKDMKWVDISNYNQKDTKQPQDIPNQVVSSKDPTDHSTPMLPDGHDNPTTPEVPQDEPKSPDVPSEVPERNGAQNDTPKVNKVLENDPKDPANEHPEDVPKVSKSPEDIRTVHEVSENVPKDPANGHPEDVPKVSKSPGDIPKVHDASENVPNIPENAQDTPNVPNDSEETEVPHDTPKVDDLHEPNVKKDISKVSKVSEDTPKAPEIPKDSLEEPKTHKKVPKVRNHSPSGPGMTTTEPSDTPNDPKEPNDTPKNGSVGHLPDVSPELESTSTLNFTQDELPETRTIKSASHRPSPTAQVSNPTMSSDALPKFGNSQEPAKLSTPKDADPMKAEPVMASSELPSRNEPSAEKKITTGQPDKESSSKSLPDAPAPDIDMPKTQALATKASKQAKQTDNPTPEKTNEPSPETSTESGPDSPASPKESNSDNPNSEVPNPDNTVEETSNKPSPDSSPEQTPKDKSPDSPIEETPKEQSPDSPIEETPKEQSPDNPEPKPPKDSNKDKPAKEKPKKKKIQKSKTKSDVVKSGKSEEQITPDMPMSGLPVEELPSDLPPPDSPPPVKAKKISTKKGQPKDMTPKSPSQETPNEPSSDSTEIETPKKISPNTPATETPETNQDNSAEETPKEPSPDSPAPEEANEESPDGPGQEGPDESSPDSPDQDKSKKSSTKKSSPKKPKGKKRKISKKNKKKRHGLIKLLAKTVKTLKPKMPLPGVSCKPNKLDLAFVIQGSGKMNDIDWMRTAMFMASIVKSLPVGKHRTRIAFNMESKYFHFLIPFFQYPRKRIMLAITKLMSMQKYIPKPSQFADMALSLRRTRKLLLQADARQIIPKVGIIISETKSPEQVEYQARELRNAGMELYSVGLGEYYSPRQIEAEASQPISDHAFYGDFMDWQSFSRKITLKLYEKYFDKNHTPPYFRKEIYGDDVDQ